MDKRLFQVKPCSPFAASLAADTIRKMALDGHAFDVLVSPPKRTLDANAAMWATLTDIAEQLEWNYTQKGKWSTGLMSKDAWKAVLTAAFESEIAMAEGVDGGVVMLGARTSQYSRKKMGEFIEFVHAFGSDHRVHWSARAKDERLAFLSHTKGAA